jgi:hypothetical protein
MGLGLNSFQVSWEAEYFSGVTVREAVGARYRDVDRDQLKVFRLVAPGEILLEFRVKDGQNGHGLAYRRRTLMGQGAGRGVWFTIGMIPNGPVVSLQPETGQVLKADKFQPGAGPLARMVPLAFERWTNTAHSTDVVLKPSRVALPSGYMLNV